MTPRGKPIKRNGQSIKLRLDPRNAKLHTPRNRAAIAKSLDSVGAGRGILADADGIIRAGNGIYQDWQARGGKVKIVPTDGKTLVVTQRTDLRGKAAIRAAALDNIVSDSSAYDYDADILAAIAADDDLVAALIKEDEHLAELLRGEPQAESADAGELVDRAAELQEKWQVVRGDLWQCGKHRILCGDSTNADDVARVMQGEKVQLVWTDPPYGVQFQGAGGDAIAGDITYTAIPLMFANMPTVLDGKAWFYICGGANNESLYSRMIEHYFRMTPRVIVWDKCGTVMRHNGYHSAYEFIYYGYQEGGGAKWYSGRDGEGASDIWRVAKPTNEAREHLTEKPVDLPLRAIRNSCPENGIALDFFLGCGGLIVACEQTGRIGRGIEIEPKYVSVSLERLSLLGLDCKRIAS